LCCAVQAAIDPKVPHGPQPIRWIAQEYHVFSCWLPAVFVAIVIVVVVLILVIVLTLCILNQRRRARRIIQVVQDQPKLVVVQTRIACQMLVLASIILAIAFSILLV
jgi:hypothetical protein